MSPGRRSKIVLHAETAGPQSGCCPALNELGFAGCVAVDYKEALVMIENGIRLGNVGHLVQTPKAALKKIVAAHPEVMTVYSLER